MARPLRVQFEGALYHLIIRANNRQPLFRDHQDRRRYLDLLSRYRGQFGCRLYAYVLMNRHVHLLMETPRGNVSKVMQCLGTSYTSYFNRRHRRRGTLFEGRYKSRLVDKDNSLSAATRYIHRNHFRISLKKKRDYPWSSYPVYLGRKSSDLVETGPVLRSFGRGLREQRRRYREFVELDNGFPGWSLAGRDLRDGSDALEPQQTAQQQAGSLENGDEPPLKKGERILREVTRVLEASGDASFAHKRKRALGRHLAMYLIRTQTALPLRVIGELLGVKAPAVARAIVKVEQLLKREDLTENLKKLLKLCAVSGPERPIEYSNFSRNLADAAETA